MLTTKEVKIGTDIYTVNYDAEMSIMNAIGQISSCTEDIRIRRLAPNNTLIPDRQQYKTLLHEIIHGIDEVVYWCKEEKEDEQEAAIELFTEYVIDYIKEWISDEIHIDDFVEYCEATEIEMKRHYLFYNMIRKVIVDNQELFLEYVEIFG